MLFVFSLVFSLFIPLLLYFYFGIWTSLRFIWLRRTFLPNSFDRRKRLVFQSDSLVVRVTIRVSTLSGVTRWRCQCRRCFLLPRYICATRLYYIHVRKLLSYCSLRANEADPRPSNFVSATDFKQNDRSGSNFLLFPQPNTSFNIHNYFTFSFNCTRSASHHKLVHKLARTNVTKNSYFYRLPRLWNALPPIDLNLSFMSIKHNLKQFFWNH